jgi:hypothetical protein
MFNIDKKILGRAATILLKGMMKAIVTDKDRWTASVHVVINVENGKVTKKEATLNTFSGRLMECSTNVIDGNLEDEDTVSSSVFAEYHD